MEMYFFNNQSRENKRIGRIKEFANKLGISFEEAEMIINNFSKMNIDPVKPAEKVNNIVTLEKLSKKIVTKVISNINNQHRHMQPVNLNILSNLVEGILKDALKQTKMIDVAKERIENQELKKQIAEINKDRERIKAALRGTLSGMMIYSELKGNAFAEEIFESKRERASVALSLSDMLDDPVKVKPVMFYFGMDMGK
ncbi:hypothetical protein [Clostridium pasteurianum]|uniref:hypothetical protein n=1 Tax=Clostridium pasteurianum TaxID=1501 RepID=UPI00039C7ED2|nr:hypothetical protein [Clostridium pasteurianum]